MQISREAKVAPLPTPKPSPTLCTNPVEDGGDAETCRRTAPSLGGLTYRKGEALVRVQGAVPPPR